MVDGEGGRDRADLPVFAEIQPANFRVLLGRDHGTPPGTRDGLATAVEGATRSRGRRPRSAARPPGARSAIDPSTCRRTVCRAPGPGGKSDPSRARDTHVDDPDDRADLPGSPDGGAGPRRPRRGERRCDTAPNNTHGRGHTPRRSQTGDGSVGSFSGEAACPRRRRGRALRLDTALTLVTQERTTGSVRRRIEAVTEGLEGSAPGPHLVPPQLVSVAAVGHDRGGAPGGSTRRPCWLLFTA